jgi:histone deacetylase 1/2
MPLRFWDEVFQMGIFLINRLPSRVIDNQTPVEHIFQKKADYSILLIFRCACWPNLRPYNSHTLQFRSKQCSFLGYSGQHKGYHCLDIATGQIFTSRDVVFDEIVFPFATLHPNVGAQFHAEIPLLPSNLHNMFGGTNE